MEPKLRRRLTPLLLLAGASSAVQAEVIDIDDGTLGRLVAEGVPVVDLRRSDEWAATGVIEGSHLVTFFDETGAYDAAAWRKALESVADADEPIVLICRTGRRTDLVSRWLSESQGFSTVYNVADGILAWRQGGGRIVPAP